MLLCPNGRAQAETVMSATDWPGCVVPVGPLGIGELPTWVVPSNKVIVPEGRAGTQEPVSGRKPLFSPTSTVNTKVELTAATTCGGRTITCGVAGVMVKLGADAGPLWR